MCFLMQSPLYLTLSSMCVCVFMFLCLSAPHPLTPDLVSPLNVIKQTPRWLTPRHTYTVHVFIHEEFALFFLRTE